MTALAIVLLAQSAALGWIILAAPDREQLLARLQHRPIDTVVEICTPALPIP